jgi:hypothetical protein
VLVIRASPSILLALPAGGRYVWGLQCSPSHDALGAGIIVTPVSRDSNCGHQVWPGAERFVR